MAVRKRADAPQAEQNPATDSKLASLLSRIDEELELKRKESAAGVRKRVLREWLKGLLAFPVAIAGGFLMSWSSKSGGFAYWFGTISGLVMFCVGLAYAVGFIKLLISGDLPKATTVLMKGIEMKEWMKVFLALVSTLGGVTLSIAGFINGRHDRWGQFNLDTYDEMTILVGIILIAGGITYFWTRSKFYKG
jgi:hypothetical protein